MRKLALILVVASACASSTDGPTPKVTSVVPSPVCDAQHAITVTISGSGFAPAVIRGLTGDPAVVLPRVLLVDASGQTTEVPPAGVSLPDHTGDTLIAVIPQNLVTPGMYGVEVENPDGNHDTLAGALTVDPPPDLVSISPTFGNVGTTVTVTLTGTGFSQAMTVTLDAMPPVAGTVTSVSTDGTTATVTFDLTGVAAGVYDITVDNRDGCTSVLAQAFTVRSQEFTLTGIDPPFGCMCSDTEVTITSAGDFVSTPQVEMVPTGQTSPVTMLKRVAFVDANTITAVVPAGLALGHYDVMVVNPPSDGRVGLLPNSFEVVAMPIPTIEDVVPDRAPPNTSVNLDIYGENFRSSIKVELVDRTGTVAATASTAAVVTATHATATITTPGTDDAYLVRVTDLDENTYSNWSAFIVGAEGASGNLHTFTPSTKLVTGRRMLAGVSARDDVGNTFVYAIGGDTGGATPTVLDTVEVAQLSKFGALGVWRQEKPSNSLTTARDAPAAAAVVLPNATDPFGPPTKTYIYVAGGRGAGGTVLGSVERAMVLPNADAPVVTSIAPVVGGTLAAGTWYYKVSAICSSGDTDNPSGETLPSDEQIITLDAAHGSVKLQWNAVATPECTASGYKVYRTSMVDGTSQKELLIATPGNVTTYTDAGATAGTEPPLPPGALGVWTTETIVLAAARWGHQAAAIADGGGGAGGLGGLYVLGGKSDATTGYLASVEYAPIDANGHLVGTTFATSGTTALPTATAFFSLLVETANNVSGYTGATPRIITCGGVDASGASKELEQSAIAAGGGNGAWSAPFSNAALLNTVGGNMAVISSDKLWSVGGARMFNNATQTFSNVTSAGDDVSFSSGDLVSPTNSAANLLPAPRALGAAITGAGFIYFVGGTSNGTDATDTTYQTF